ncbi:hypothetical protein PRIPAC_78803 [Pristionchus pacificus]|uniref:Uncharacterized protein n=1 Tax=Pristionchus pacificus TaxID=54126 RepID=A0A2A6BVR3_PRIPA|nr:hypothetical protein PRIPAC_78803 [Pristionchus pacificus]|eukprot:PDM69873.1 hypothetical protein PRIPAC_49085 [Pristionchus pacificus]
MPLPFALLLLLVSFFAHSEAHSPTYVCEWVGTAPFCRGECEFPWKEFRKAEYVELESRNSANNNEKGDPIEFGWSCWRGMKTLCCRENFKEVLDPEP